ncbi:chromate efflux transporter [Paenibacillus methanolicus]|uniref:Chromate transporter n=1 Tax=Paenibacillus methanolicus TaxID=582686 RepID=A0A5S5C382_9BACL|nr:chromate efflux transporter [Paenibacillus methanolicus]TYP73885.1 chromate transporter [Paenibacillus methanolicus]
MNTNIERTEPRSGSIWEIFRVALRLGLTSFGGPVAHLGYFRAEYVERRQWLNDRAYAELVSLCQLLPGPASSQVGIAIGMLRGGWLGGLAAWSGFTLPSALALAALAFVLEETGSADGSWAKWLLLVAVAVVAQAVQGMARTLAPERKTGTVALAAAVASLLWPSAWMQLIVLSVAAIVGLLLFHRAGQAGDLSSPLPSPVSARAAVWLLGLFTLLLIGLPFAAAVMDNKWVQLADIFYRAGSLVFGGGHVVLPMLEPAMAEQAWMSGDRFMAGYGAAQAVPGPLFTISAYIGMAADGWLGALIALLAMFLPSFLLVGGALPFWNAIRGQARLQAALTGVNAAVVGILLAALYNPVFTGAVHNEFDLCVVLAAYALLVLWKVPAWLLAGAALAAGIATTWWM